VFCGSQTGVDPVYKDMAHRLGVLLASKGISLIFGGGGIGLMGVLADSVMEHGGKAIGVIPRFLSDRELGHTRLSELIMVESMHERKQKMAQLADGFLALPGGFGTLEELCEILTWRQLNIVDKPIGVLNVKGFFNHLDNLLNHMIKEEFINEDHKKLLMIEDDAEVLLNAFQGFSPGITQDIEKT
jgi:uncharacterized protein (TIGR00730 family)